MWFCLRFERWEDGERVQRVLDAPDRWEVHSAESVEVTLGDLHVTILQQPTSLTYNRVGVGACLWDGALLLAAYLAVQPRYRFQGATCVELGAGVGLVGLALAKMGAQVVLTDLKKVLPLLERNLEANGYGGSGGRTCHPGQGGGGTAKSLVLDWGNEASMRWADQVAADRPPDFVLAADCCYVDNEGQSPCTRAFVRACARLCGPRTRVLVASERRSTDVRNCFVEEAHAAFERVRDVPLAALPAPLRLEYCDLWELIPRG